MKKIIFLMVTVLYVSCGTAPMKVIESVNQESKQDCMKKCQGKKGHDRKDCNHECQGK